MEKIKKIKDGQDVLKLLTVAIEHEWAVSLEYLIHAYSMPKARFFYQDPIMEISMDIRSQVIQIGLDEMYHAFQLGLILRQMGQVPSFRTDEIFRYRRIIDNLARDKKTEDMVTELYQAAEFLEDKFPFVKNMVRNIAGDEVRHSRQFQAMIDSIEFLGQREALIYTPSAEAESKPEVEKLHKIMQLENELMHRYLYYMLLFSDHQDLSQRLFKNSINHMRHWDKNSGLLIKMGSVIRFEAVEIEDDGIERSQKAMPNFYPPLDRVQALQALRQQEEELMEKYQEILKALPPGEIKEQIILHLGLNREHLFTLDWLLNNARQIFGSKTN